jgi:hypothetical protein
LEPASPAYKLDVNGNANFTNGFYTNTDASSTSYFVGANGTRPIIFQNNTGASYDFGFKFFDSNTFTIVGGNIHWKSNNRFGFIYIRWKSWDWYNR